MSDQIEFILRMKDVMSGMFPRVGNTAQTTFNKVNSHVSRTQENFSRLGREIDVVNRKMGTLQTTTAVFVGSLASQGFAKGIGAIKAGITGSLDAAMQAGMRGKSFEVLTHSPAVGKGLFGDLRKLKQTSLVGGGVYQNAQTLLGFGEKHGNIVKDLKQIGDIGMGDQQRMESLSLVRAQVIAAGKLMGQDMLQFVNAGFNPLKVMSDNWASFGFKQKQTVGQLRTLMEQGKISASMVAQSFDVATSKGGDFYRMMEQIAETPMGKKMLAEGKEAAIKIDLGNQMMPLNLAILEKEAELLEWMEQNHTVENLKPAVEGLTNAFIGAVKWTTTHTGTLKVLFGLAKTGAEIWVAWKVYTVASTGANWLWVKSMQMSVAEAVEATTAIQAENTALIEQEELLAALVVEYDALTVSITGMSAAQKAAMATGMANAANIATSGAAGVAAGRAATTGVASLGASIAAGMSKVVMTVGIAWLAADIANTLLGTGDGFFGHKENGEPIEWWNVMERWNEMDRKHDRRVQAMDRSKHPTAIMSGNPNARWDWLFGGESGYNQKIFDKYGVQNPGSANNDETANAIGSAGESIVGGGRRQTIINVNAPMYKVEKQVFESLKGQLDDFEPKVKEALLRILHSANAARS